MDKQKVFRGFLGISALLLTVSLTGTGLCLKYQDAINTYIGGDDTTGGEANQDAIYYKSEFGDFNEENQAKLIEEEYAQVVKEMEEGAVLLKNESSALPLDESERGITVFGSSCVNPVIKCSSSGNTASGEFLTTMKSALTQTGFRVNESLYGAYGGETNTPTQDLNRGISEKPKSFYTDEIKNSWASDYNDAAIIFLSRESGEGNDFSMNDEEGISSLALHQNERDLVEMVTKDSHFKKVIVILNVPTSMEVGWLEEYDIDACLWIGAPGQTGFLGMANILTGEANPSGHLVDTYAKNSLNAPAVVNSGSNASHWANGTEVLNNVSDKVDSHVNNYTVQLEGIYIGYKYYETRYEDYVMNVSNAKSTIGSTSGSAWSYENEMSYTFGYGLSYTTFDQTFNEVKLDENGNYTVSVTVRNTGTTKGKDVVEVYAQTPYGEYEKTNKVEKSAVQLVGYAKTSLLNPGEEETLEVSVDPYLFASYDSNHAKTYILSEGDYYLSIGTDAHDALNNILCKKGYGVADGMDASGDASKAYTWHMDFDDQTYRHSKTGTEVTNQFDDCDINVFLDDSKKVTYMTRNDWTTYPKKVDDLSASTELMRIIDGSKDYEIPSDSKSVSSYKLGVDKNIKLIDMKGLDYDDPKWDEYLSQMTVEELASQTLEGFSMDALEKVGKPKTSGSDGMDSTGFNYLYGDKRAATNYTSTVTLCCSWNTDLFRRRGELLAEDTLWIGRIRVLGIGGDLHRTQFGGRNFEYISEDANFCYLYSTIEVEAIQSKGTDAFMKHMATNDQETYRTGLNTFFTEQEFREVSLRLYEGAVTKSNMHGIMTGLNRLGGRFCSESKGMLTNVLRKEWGFVGIVMTDADSATYPNPVVSLAAGLNIFCCDFSKKSSTKIVKAINAGDGYALENLINAVHENHYRFANNAAMNGITRETSVSKGTSWWEISLYVLDGVLASGTIALIYFFVTNTFRKPYKNQEGQEND